MLLVVVGMAAAFRLGWIARADRERRALIDRRIEAVMRCHPL
jgi:hypothetical protein